MKSTISILLFCALPFVIYGVHVPIRFRQEVKNINRLAEKKTVINNVLLPIENGFLGDGGYGFVYEGILLGDDISVAIKFVKNESIEICKREMAIYSYLKAFNNETVDLYGIPVVYYYGRWKNYILMALKKFDMSLSVVVEGLGPLGDNPLDILILLRDFVFQSKYLHSHGVRHNDIKPENIMLRGHRSFLIDFNGGSKMMEDDGAGTLDYGCKRLGTGEKRRAIDDYESFVYTISFVMGKNWFRPGYDNKRLKNYLRDDGLEGIIKAFANEVFTDDATKEFPNYNYLEGLISREINTIHSYGELTFSWITFDAETSPPRNIEHIDDPKSINFTRFRYPPKVCLT